MRHISKKILHCSDTRVNQNFSIKDITNWHTGPKFNPKNGQWRYKKDWYSSKDLLPEEVQHLQGNDWSRVGYHFYIRLNGVIEIGCPIEKPGIHCKGENLDSIGICFEGGKNEDGSKWDKPLDIQEVAFFVLNLDLNNKYGVTPVFGHYQFSRKTCPNFNVDELMDRFFKSLNS